jgi:hypothetical protein
MPKLTKQQQKVCNYIRDYRGCTTKDIQANPLQGGLGIECPSGRIAELRKLGLIEKIGSKKYPGARPFARYAIVGIKKPQQVVETLPSGSVRVSYV